MPATDIIDQRPRMHLDPDMIIPGHLVPHGWRIKAYAGPLGVHVEIQDMTTPPDRMDETVIESLGWRWAELEDIRDIGPRLAGRIHRFMNERGHWDSSTTLPQ
jgi:hypothetical protein